MEYTLLIDGGNLLRASFSDTRVNSEGIHYGGVFQFLLQVKLMLNKKMYDYIYVFFDDEDSGILRYNIYNDYKANRGKKYGEHEDRHGEISDYWRAYEARLKGMRNYFAKKEVKVKDKTDKERIVDENFARERDLLIKYFDELYIRCIFDDVVEGDDFISYYVKHKRPDERIVIMSTDEDLTQLISDTVCVYNKRIDKYLSVDNFKKIKGFPIENVAVKKIMCGDTSDNIKNISGLSEARLFEMMPELKERPVTIEEIKSRAQELIDERIQNKKKPIKYHENIINGVSNGNYDGDFYEINRKLVDLSEPLITDRAKETIDSMMYAPQDPEGRSFENLYRYMHEDGIDELKDSNHFASFFEQFKAFADREVRRFKEENDE